MLSLLLRLGRWLSGKGALIIMIALAGVGSCALYLYVRDHWQLEIHRTEALQSLKARQAEIDARVEELSTRAEALAAEARIQRDRLERTERIISRLRELEDWWSRLFGNSEQREANARQVEKLRAMKEQTAGRLSQIGTAMAAVRPERERLHSEADTVRLQLERLQQSPSRLRYYLERAWEQVSVPVMAAIAALVFGPVVVKGLLYFGWASLLGLARPVRLKPGSSAAEVSAGKSRVSLPISLGPGEALWIKEGFLQASDEQLRRRTRFVFDWSVPFTSLACGLIELIEMKNEGAEPRAVTCSSQEDPHIELAPVNIPAGASIILRPRCLAGIVKQAGSPLVIRRHWRLFALASWVALRFRYFEFAGPCRLLVAGSRGVRVEWLGSADPAPARRTNAGSTVGFAPALELRPVRAETFWSYFRDKNPLFDDVFSGRGLFLCQETSSAAERAGRRFWSNFWNGLLKVFGL